jgi:hypothetical protein
MSCENLRFPWGDGVVGEGGPSVPQEVKDELPPFPYPATLAMVEALHSTRGWVVLFLEHGREERSKCVSPEAAFCKCLWMKLRMKFSAGCLQCRPAEASRCYDLCPETYDVLSETFEQRDALSFQNEYSDDL